MLLPVLLVPLAHLAVLAHLAALVLTTINKAPGLPASVPALINRIRSTPLPVLANGVAVRLVPVLVPVPAALTACPTLLTPAGFLPAKVSHPVHQARGITLDTRIMFLPVW